MTEVSHSQYKSHAELETISNQPIDIFNNLPRNDDNIGHLNETIVFGIVTVDYAAKDPTELSLEEMDVVKVLINRNSSGKYYGILNDLRGWFPVHIVKILTEEEAILEGLLKTNVDLEDDDQNAKMYNKYFSDDAKQETVKSVLGINMVKSNSSFKLDEITEAPIPVKNRSRAPGKRLLWVEYVGADNVELLSLSKQEIKRQEVIFEIITTEEDYVDDLELVLQVKILLNQLYIRPLEKNKLIRPKDMAIIFSNIEQFLPVNQELLRSLETLQNQSTTINMIGDAIIRVSDYLKMYTMYCSNHPHALMKLQAVRQSKSVAKFLDQQHQNPLSRSLDLSNFLLKPIQRVCKYPLLVRELIKYTDSGHPDFECLNRALLKIEAIVTTINEGARNAENVRKMIELQSKFPSKVSLIAPSRVLVKSDSIDSFNQHGERRTRKVYVFNDMIVLAKPDGEKLKLLHMISFDNILLNEIQSNEESPDFTIELVYTGKEKVKLVFPSLDARQVWLKTIQNTISEFMIQKTRIFLANVGLSSNSHSEMEIFFGTDPAAIAKEPTIEEKSTQNFDAGQYLPSEKKKATSTLPFTSIISTKTKEMNDLKTTQQILQNSVDSLNKSIVSEANPGCKAPIQIIHKAVPLIIQANVKENINDHNRSATAPSVLFFNMESEKEALVPPQTISSHSVSTTSNSLAATETVSIRSNPPDSLHSQIPISKLQINSVSRPVKKAMILEVTKESATSLIFQYHIQVIYYQNIEYASIWRKFEDFLELHLQLIGHFPDAAGIKVGPSQELAIQETQPRILPQLPQKMMFVSETVAKNRIYHLQSYIDVIFGLIKGSFKSAAENISLAYSFKILQTLKPIF